MKVHFIAIGGAAMHNMALALQHKNYQITGSDDEINEPSRSRLKNAGLLPEEMGWFPEKITTDLDAVILGMHARAENPELLRAKELGVKVFSYPEYLYEQSKNKKRLVIGGSHGKTSITAMVLHVLQDARLNFDYMVGSQLAGFERMVKLTEEAPIIVLEGDEYLSSPIDRRPKFHLYKADVALLSGIAWDHINVFPTFENYVEQFQIYVDQIPADGALIYCKDDVEVRAVCEKAQQVKSRFPYSIPPHHIENGITILESEFGNVALEIFGDHNLLNLEGARLMCNQVGVGDAMFYKSIATFKGAARRLELIGNSDKVRVYKDFAHSPSKLMATTKAVKQQFQNRKVIACMELHTFSSLNAEFLDHYKDSMNEADIAIVYYNPQTIAHKKLEPITHDQVKKAFAREDLLVMSDSTELKNYLTNFPFQNDVLLLMSSGTFDGLDLESLIRS
ncbi:MAG: peptidoglycan synthetase [Bacteroidetes bacterium]|nr:peptidoglycan synthetase [Bacteroidota bacterium]